ncbi:hypothetical protein GSI_12012 [Ganoderma sinense ZZ0214-1]|uniref:Uncharacterized protein n=1 Tax=Ganoderma sinense ZZ0214-1 TaxID=1077348 RepID=A0A2G8RXL2_9APHY|nr:hypothetical protein GSI_12012 [Ganoderma sinense ZZ0214-1]
MFSKSRSSTSSYPAQMNAADRTVTIALPTSTHPASPSPTRADQIAVFQYQQELLEDFFSGGAAPRPRPPQLSTSSHSSHSHSHSASSKSKTKWGAVLSDRDAKAKAAGAAAYPEPTTLSKRMFQFGFVCPLLWLFAGVVFSFRPPRPRIEHEGLPVNSAEERGRRIAVYRAAEERWRKRCVVAWMTFMIVVIIVVPTLVVWHQETQI